MAQRFCAKAGKKPTGGPSNMRIIAIFRAATPAGAKRGGRKLALTVRRRRGRGGDSLKRRMKANVLPMGSARKRGGGGP